MNNIISNILRLATLGLSAFIFYTYIQKDFLDIIFIESNSNIVFFQFISIISLTFSFVTFIIIFLQFIFRGEPDIQSNLIIFSFLSVSFLFFHFIQTELNQEISLKKYNELKILLKENHELLDYYKKFDPKIPVTRKMFLKILVEKKKIKKRIHEKKLKKVKEELLYLAGEK